MLNVAIFSKNCAILSANVKSFLGACYRATAFFPALSSPIPAVVANTGYSNLEIEVD